VTHIDGDVLFFSDPSTVMSSVADRSVVLTSHRSGDAAFERRFGTYNAGWLTFACDAQGLAALDWWRRRCAESTPDYPVGGRFGEQKYLDALPALFDNVGILHTQGINLAPWNVAASTPLSRSPQGDALVGDQPLVCFHFHGFERWSRHVFAAPPSTRRQQPHLRALIYVPYAHALRRAEALVAATSDRKPQRPAPWGSSRARPWWWRSTRLLAHRAAVLARRRLILVA
jgi:hypothetical protein